MRDVIIVSKNPQAAERVRTILQSGRILVNTVYTSGAEVLSYASIRPEAVVVCGKIVDMPATTLASMLPNGYDVVWLMPSGEPTPLYRSNLSPLQMPLNRMEFLNTVRSLASVESETSRPKLARSAEDEAILQAAKKSLMARQGVSEREAHKLLQRRSMADGIRLIEVARLVLEKEKRDS